MAAQGVMIGAGDLLLNGCGATGSRGVQQKGGQIGTKSGRYWPYKDQWSGTPGSWELDSTGRCHQKRYEALQTAAYGKD